MKRRITTRLFALMMALMMAVSLLPTSAFAASGTSDDEFIRVFHLDCGRKYFTVEQVKELIDAISAANYTHMELAFGNNGMRFLLDDMKVTVNGTTYSGANVTAGIQAGNLAYNGTKGYEPSVNELTETDMNAIIDYAKSKNIEIIPLLNTPGHMDALVTAMSRLDMTPKYLNSSSTIDLEDTAAVAFTKALVLKYAQYFAAKGCRYFNIGADEYANDIDNAGFAGLINGDGDGDQYGLFVDYVNALVEELCKLNMTPIAFNDGIYYNRETGFGTFDNRLVIAYWTGGYSGYTPAPVDFLTGKGHKVLYTKENWYYVLGRNNSGTYNYNTALDAAQNISVDSERPQDIGAMQCLWCDEPTASYEDNKSKVMTLISTLSASNTDYFVAADEGSGDGGNTGDDTTAYNETIDLEVGGTREIVIKNVNYDGTYATKPTGIATVVAKYKAGEGGAGPVQVTTISVGSSYYLSDGNGNFLTNSAAWTTDISEAALWTVSLDDVDYYLTSGANHLYYYDNAWGVASYGDPFTVESGAFCNAFNSSAKVFPFIISDTAAVDQSTITFTGVAPGTTYATVGDTTYKIVVTGKVNITINYVANGTVIKTENVTVADNATTYTVSSFNHNNGKFYVVDSNTLAIDPKNTTVYTVNVTETTDNPDDVAPLTIEYWQTNRRVNAPEASSAQSLSVAALDAYSEAGLSLIDIIPAAGFQDRSPVVYWRSRLLGQGEHQESYSGAADRTWSGTGFTKVRYWNGTWAVYTDAGEWLAIVPANYQLVAYYMNDMDLANEVNVGTSDWGKKGDGNFADQPLEFYNSVSLSFQVIYEDGLTTVPATTTAADLKSTTYLVNNWEPNRGVGTITLTQIGDYQIGKITAETGTHEKEERAGGSVVVTNFNWGENDEMVVYEGDPVSQYTIVNPNNDPLLPGDEGYEPYYQNLTWRNAGESILIRIYLKTVKTDDSLTVVYFDEKFNDTLYTYNISVENGKTFTTDLTGTSLFTGEAPETGRLDVSKATIVNKLGEPQYFQTDLTQVPDAKGKYNSGLYTHTGAKISADGKTLTLYYTINTKTLSPNFVVDFGLPFSFPLSDVVGEGQDKVVESVSVNEKTRYGTLAYDPTTEMFTYTPTGVLQNVDVLAITIKFDGEEATITNVGVTPASNVLYEDDYMTPASGSDVAWTVAYSKDSGKQQDVFATKDADQAYGYDDAYELCTGPSGSVYQATLTGTSPFSNDLKFTFTGTGFDLIGTAGPTTGTMMVRVNDAAGNFVKAYLVDTAFNDKTYGTLYQVPMVHAQDMPYGAYEVVICGAYINYAPAAMAAFSLWDEPAMPAAPAVDPTTVIYELMDKMGITDEQIDEVEFISMESLYGMYTLSADDGTAPAAAPTSMTVELDGFRVYRPTNDGTAGDSYAAVEQNLTYSNILDLLSGSFAAYIEGTADGSYTVADYEGLGGPQNEVYLTSGNALGFATTGEKVQVSLRSVDGNRVTIKITNGSGNKEMTLDHTTELWYKVNPNTDNGYVTIEVVSGMLAIGNVKQGQSDANVAALTEADYPVMFTMLRRSVMPETPVDPETPTDPETPIDPETPTDPETPIDPETPTDPENPGEPETPEDTKDPDTGDHTPVTLLSGAMLLAAAGIILMLRKPVINFRKEK